MRVAVAAAAMPPRYATPTHPGRHLHRQPTQYAHPWPADYRLSPARVKGACGVAARALRAPRPGPPLARPGSYQGMGADQRTLSTQPQTSTFMIKLPQKPGSGAAKS